MQAGAYAGFTKLYEANRKTGPIIEAACWAHSRCAIAIVNDSNRYSPSDYGNT